MTHIKVTIDNKVEFDGSVTEWERKSPDFIKDVIKPDAKPQPWMVAIAMAMANAVTARRSTDIDAITGVDEWTLKVRYR